MPPILLFQSELTADVAGDTKRSPGRHCVDRGDVGEAVHATVQRRNLDSFHSCDRAENLEPSTGPSASGVVGDTLHVCSPRRLGQRPRDLQGSSCSVPVPLAEAAVAGTEVDGGVC